jgi:hypothetical protein
MSAPQQQTDGLRRSSAIVPPTLPAQPSKNAEDPTAWTKEPHEDPDEVPHDVVGLLALGLVLMALVTAVLWMVAGPVVAGIVGGILGLFTVIRLSRRARRERIEESMMPKDLVEGAPAPGSGGARQPTE